MTEKRFTIDEDGNITDTINDRCLYVENRMTECDYFVNLLNEQHETIKSLEKQCTLLHMRSMFSTVKSFKGDISKRYKYDEETDTIYDTANHYGQYNKILDKKEIVMLLNEYNTLLGDVE